MKLDQPTTHIHRTCAHAAILPFLRAFLLSLKASQPEDDITLPAPTRILFFVAIQTSIVLWHLWFIQIGTETDTNNLSGVAMCFLILTLISPASLLYLCFQFINGLFISRTFIFDHHVYTFLYNPMIASHVRTTNLFI